MATQYYNIKGRIKWAKVYEPDEFSGAENWKVNFYPFDGGEWEKFQKTGLQNVPKEDEDGKFVTLRRPVKKLINDELVIFSPPEITGAVNVSYQDDEGNPVRSYNKSKPVKIKVVGEKEILGNGTLVVLNISVYDTAKGKGGRFESLRVLDLVGMPENKRDEPVTEDEADEAVVEDATGEKEEKLPW